jgi:hypothetical protein
MKITPPKTRGNGKYLERLLEPTGKAGRGPVMMSGLMRLNLKEDPEQKRYLAVTGVIWLTIFQHLRFDTSNCSDI